MSGSHAKPNRIPQRMATVGTSAVLMAAAPAAAQAATIDQWDKVAQCEAGGNWSINWSGDGLSVGGLQFQNPSWRDALAELRRQGVDASGYPTRLYQGMPNVPSKEQQIMAGEALLKLQGPGAWACNGYAALGSRSASMFLGGPKPFGKIEPPSEGVSRGGNETAPDGGRSESHRYVVRAGDTLSGIASAYRVKGGWRALFRANSATINDPDLIYPNQVVTVPAARAEESTPEPEAPKPAASYFAPVVAPITQAFHNPNSGYGTGWHTGVDFTAPSGTAVRAAAAGRVVVSSFGGGAGSAYGNHVVIDHGNGRYTLYGHLSVRTAWVGQKVAAGQEIGKVGSTGNSTGPHLHFELRNSATAYGPSVFSDPVAWLRSHGVRL